MKFISDHSERWKTAAGLLLLISIVGLLDNRFLTWLFLGTVYFFGLQEAKKLFRAQDSSIYIYSTALWLLIPFYPHPVDLLIFTAMIFASKLAYNKKDDPHNLFPLLYPGAGMIFIWTLYVDYGMISLAWILVIVALTDVGAFYVGKKFGRTGFSPTSPNKTLEGVFGGILIGTVGGSLLMMGHGNIFINGVLISMITSATSVFGDLFESYLKREAGVKDSGNILPGHGGVLDRIDGYLFASISLYVILKITGS